ncbi:MAG: damage-inducible protein CinA, partial [Calditrichaeota bacterium]
VYVGLATANGVEARKFVFGEDRLINKERATYAALQMLYKALKDRM